MRHKSNNKTRPLFTLSLEMTRLCMFVCFCLSVCRLLHMAVSILQHKLVNSSLERTLLRERIYNTALDFFA